MLNWDDPSYRAEKLKLALRGPPAKYIAGENSRAKEWTTDDELIIKKLEERYILKDATELKIIDAENISQDEREPLPEYMTRVQALIEEAYEGEPQAVIQKRVAWKFLSGIKNKEIRTTVIKEKWMKDKLEAKSPEELLQIAEVARMNMAVAGATGTSKPSGSDKQEGLLGNFNNSKNPRRARDQLKCLYCKRFHPGGWETCFKRLRVDPDWKPSSKTDSQKSKKERDQGF